jgi:hypothetical protein
MRFFEFSQNNSGGSFHTDKNVCHRLFIEADSLDSAVSKAEELGCYWDGVRDGLDCPCCGDRWSVPWWKEEGYDYPYDYASKDRLVFDTVEEHAQHLANDFGWTTPDARIFYANGDIKEIFAQKEKR